MGQISLKLSDDFLFPKLHGRWAEAFDGERLDAVIRASHMQAVVRALGDMGIAFRDRASVQKDLTRALITELGEIRRFLAGRTADYYSRFAERFFIENLKTLLHFRYFPDQDVDIQYLIVDSPLLPHLPVRRLCEATSLHQFHKLLPAHDIKDDLLPLLVELDDTHDLFVAESRIDTMYHGLLSAAAAGLPGRLRQLGIQLCRNEIDITNIVTLLRNISIYNLPGEMIRPLLIPGGALDDDRAVDTLVACADEDALLRSLPPPYGPLLGRWQSAPVHRRENALWSLLYEHASDAFSDYDRPANSVAAYPFLKRFEHLNMARVFEGVYLKLEPTIMQQMMIGATRV